MTYRTGRLTGDERLALQLDAAERECVRAPSVCDSDSAAAESSERRTFVSATPYGAWWGVPSSPPRSAGCLLRCAYKAEGYAECDGGCVEAGSKRK